MIGHLRVKSPWSQLGLFLGLLGAGLATTSLVLAAIVLGRGLPIGALDQLDWSQPKVLSTMKLVQAISSVTIFLLPALIFSMVVFTRRKMYFMGFRPPVRPAMYGLAIVCILVAFPFVGWLGDLNQSVHLPDWMTKLEKDAGKQMALFLKAGSTFDVILNVLIIALLPALCEEFFFRGMLQRIIIQISRNPWSGILITSVLFSAAHLQFEGFLPRMFLGVVLGALYWYSGSLWTSVLAHFVNNAVQVVLISYQPEYIDKNPTLPVFLSLVSGLAVLAILWIYKSYSTITYDKVYEPDVLNSSNEFIA